MSEFLEVVSDKEIQKLREVNKLLKEITLRIEKLNKLGFFIKDAKI
jgi:hypothetical protein